MSQDSINVADTETLTESIWSDYTISQLPTLENNLENVMSEDLMDTDIVSEQLLHHVENETVAVLQPISIETDDTLMVTCRCCNKNFTFYDLKLHIAEKSTEGYYGCDLCSEIFLLKEDLNNHMLKHLNAEESLKCSQCSSKFQNEVALNEHKKIHTTFRCSICIEDFAGSAELELHMNELHATKRVRTESGTEETETKKDKQDTAHQEAIADAEIKKTAEESVRNRRIELQNRIKLF